MNYFRSITINNFGWELSYAKEVGKSKLGKKEKRYIRKLSRTRLKRDVNNDK